MEEEQNKVVEIQEVLSIQEPPSRPLSAVSSIEVVEFSMPTVGGQIDKAKDADEYFLESDVPRIELLAAVAPEPDILSRKSSESIILSRSSSHKGNEGDLYSADSGLVEEREDATPLVSPRTVNSIASEGSGYLTILPLPHRPAAVPPLEELFGLPSNEFEFVVPKSSDGQLRIHVRHDDEGDIHGLFIHGFKPNSVAEQQGLVQIGDELLSLDDVNVEGKFLSVVVEFLKAHEGDSVRMRLRRRVLDSSIHQPQVKSARTSMSARSSAIPTPRVFQIHDKVSKPEEEPSLEQLSMYPAVDIDVVVPKTQGELRIYIRHDDEGDAHGLFIHGFKPNSNAERQGLLQVGDELLEVNGINVKGMFLEDVVSALQGHDEGVVSMRIRRHLFYEDDDLLAEISAQEQQASDEAEAERVAIEEQRIALENQLRLEEERLAEIARIERQKVLEAERLEKIKAEEEARAALQLALEEEARRQQEALEEEARLEREALEQQFRDELNSEMGEGAKEKRERQNKIRLKMEADRKLKQLELLKEAEERALSLNLPPNSLLSSAADIRAKMDAPFVDFDVVVPKTSGELKIHVKYNKLQGLFIQGFKPDSLAEKMGKIDIGDELLWVEGVDCRGKPLAALVKILQGHMGNSVRMRLRRHKRASNGSAGGV